VLLTHDVHTNTWVRLYCCNARIAFNLAHTDAQLQHVLASVVCKSRHPMCCCKSLLHAPVGTPNQLSHQQLHQKPQQLLQKLLQQLQQKVGTLCRLLLRQLPKLLMQRQKQKLLLLLTLLHKSAKKKELRPLERSFWLESDKRQEGSIDEKKRKDYAFWRQFNEKPSVILGCPGSIDAQACNNTCALCSLQLSDMLLLLHL